MTTIELKRSILAELDQMSLEMLENVSYYVRRLSRHARNTRKTVSKEDVSDVDSREITPRVMRFKKGNPWYATDEEVNRLRYEYLTEKYK